MSYEQRIARIAEELEKTHSPYYAQKWMECVRYLGPRWVLYRMAPKLSKCTW